MDADNLVRFEESFGSAKSVVRLVMETVNQSSISKVEC